MNILNSESPQQLLREALIRKHSIKNLFMLKNENELSESAKASFKSIKRASIKLINENIKRGSIIKQKQEYFFDELKNQLIEEIKKPTFKESFALRKKRRGEIAFDRKIGKITNLLKLLPGFQKFMTYYNVDDEALIKVSSNITYKRFPKGSYIFKQGDKSDFFYGIISGKISIRDKKKIAVKIEEDDKDKETNQMSQFFSCYKGKKYERKEKMEYAQIEYEKLALNEGQCFGEWGLIYKQERASSAYCEIDCDLFMLNANNFEMSFTKCMAKAEMDRKIFLIRCIPFFKTIQKFRFDHFYKGFIALYHPKGKQIYAQDTKAEVVYVVYQGLCSIQKNFSNSNSDPKIMKVMYLESGDLAGLEALSFIPVDNTVLNKQTNLIERNFGINEELSAPFYKTSLVSENDETIVIQIKMSVLNEFRKVFVNSLKSLRVEKDYIIDNLIKEKQEMIYKHKVMYREEKLQMQMKHPDQIEKDELTLNSKVNICIDECRNKMKDKFKYNNLKNFTIKINQDFYQTIRDNNSSEKKANFNITNVISKSTKEIFNNSFYSKLNYNKNEEESLLRDSSSYDTSPRLITSIKTKPMFKILPRASPNGCLSLLAKAIKKKITGYSSDNNLKRSDSNRYTNTGPSTQRNVDTDDSQQSDYYSVKIRELDSPTKFSVKSSNLRKQILLMNTTSQEDSNESAKSTIKTSNVNKLILKQMNSENNSKQPSKSLVSKEVADNIKKWGNSLNTKIFMTGRFEMPLVCLSKSISKK